MSHAQTHAVSNEDDRSFFQELREGEDQWAWKFGFRVALCVLDVVGIGCAAWLASTALMSENGYFVYSYYIASATLIGALVMLSVSLVWCAVVLFIYFLRRPPKPVHPGICVAIDLILWLALIVTAIFTIGAIFALADNYYDPSSFSDVTGDYSGHYVLKPNGTWVWKFTYVDDPCTYSYSAKDCRFNYTTGEYESKSNRTIEATRDCTPYFASCKEQDAHINELYEQKSSVLGIEITVGAVQWLGVLFHFILFVWACVDTHKYNQKAKAGNTAEMVDKVIRDMESRGLITVHSTATGRTQGTEMNEVSGPVTVGNSRAAPEDTPFGPSIRREEEIGRAQ